MRVGTDSTEAMGAIAPTAKTSEGERRHYFRPNRRLVGKFCLHMPKEEHTSAG